MQYAMEIIARARQAELLREAESQRLGRGAQLRGRSLPHLPTRQPLLRRRESR